MSVEIVGAQLSADQARELTDRIRGDLEDIDSRIESLRPNVLAAWAGNAVGALSYESWGTYCAAEFGHVRNLKLPTTQRGELVASLRGEGMSTRGIADAIGVDEKTVRNDLATAENSAVEPPVITGVNGKKYTHPQRKPAAPQPEPVEDIDEDALAEELAALGPLDSAEIEAEIVELRQERENAEHQHQIDLVNVGRARSLNAWDEFAVKVRAAVSHARTWPPPTEIPADRIGVGDVKEWIRALAQISEGWE